MADLVTPTSNKSRRKTFRRQDIAPVFLLLSLWVLSKCRLASQNILLFVLFAVFIPPFLFCFWWRFRSLRVNQGWMLAVLIPPSLLGLALSRNWGYVTFFSALAVCGLMILLGRFGPQSQISTGKDADSGESLS